jgi:hypothetical protein
MVRTYRKKPVDIQAVQLTGKNIFEAYSFVYGKPDLSHNIASDKWDEYVRIVRERGMDIKTLEDGEDGRALHVASIGDYIIKGVEGEFYPCKPGIFEKTYEISSKTSEAR